MAGRKDCDLEICHTTSGTLLECGIEMSQMLWSNYSSYCMILFINVIILKAGNACKNSS